MIEILRLSHRIARDKRISTHLGLTSRAFLADKMYYSGQKDSSLESSIIKINKNFGSNFTIEFIKDPIKLVKEKKTNNYFIVHLTCYGLRIMEKIQEIRKKKKILVVIGSEKVPTDFYHIADLNISISNQPHSELSALAIFLHEYFEGKELSLNFDNAKISINPSERGKNIQERT